MKLKLTAYLLVLSLIGFSQAPQLINYQGVAREANGTPIIGTIGVKFELRQGSAASPTVFTEVQSLTTGTLGVFSTQIGKAAGSNLSTVNWESGLLFLEVSLSLSGGTFTSMGVQQLVSVPYSMYAQSVPATYTNNILTIGTQAFTLTPSSGAVYTASTGISITSGSIITNTAPDVPVTFTSSSSNIAINGAYPNFGISYTSTPLPTSLTLSGAANNSLSAGNNTVVLNTYTAGSGITLSGGPNFTISSSAANPTVNGGGVAVVSPTTGNNFTVTVPNPSIVVTNTLLTLTQGTSVSTATLNPPTLSLSGTNNNSLTAGNNTIALNSYTAGTGITMSGGPNYTISASAANATLNGGGVAVVSPTTGNNFTVTVPNPSITVTNTLLTLTQGTSVSTATLNPPTLSLSGINNTGLTAGNNTVTLNSYTVGSGLTMSGGPNYTISSSGASPSVQGAGVAVVSPTTGSNFTVTVPNPSIAVSHTLLTLTQGASTSTTTLNNYTVGSGLTMSGGPNYTISSSAASPTIIGDGVAVVTPTTGSNFTVSVPNPVLSVAGTTLTVSQGTAVSTANIPTSTVTASGIASVTPTGLTYNINVPVPNFQATGATSIQGSYPNYTVVTPAASVPTLVGTGAAIITPSSGLNFVVDVPLPSVTATTGIATVNTAGTHSFNINVPAPTYNSFTGALNTGTATANITQALTFTNGILTSGPSNNSVTLPASINTSIYPAGSASVSGVFPSYTVSAPASPSITGTGLAIVSPSTGANITVNVPVLTYTPSSGGLGSGTNSVDITAPLTLNGSTLTSGPISNSINLSALSPFTTTGASIYQTNLTHSVGIGTNAPAAKLDIVESATYTGTHLKVQNSNAANAVNAVDFASNGTGNVLNVLSSNSATTAVAALFDGGIISKGKTATTSGYAFRAINSASSDLFVVRNDGHVGIGVASPTAVLTVSNSASSETGYFEVNNATSTGHALLLNSNSGNQHTQRALNLSAPLTIYAGFFEGGLVGRAKNNPNAFALVGKSFAGTDLFVVRNDGNVGINNTNPTATLDINGTMRFVDGNEGLNKVLTSNASGYASWQNVPSGWGLSGSAGTSSTTNYIGTSDAQGLVIGTNGAKRITVMSTGEVAIGTTVNPVAPLVVQGSGANVGVIKLYNGNASSNDQTFIGFAVHPNGGDVNDIARMGSIRSLGGGEGRLFFATGTAGSPLERMRIDEFGNVGIGTSNPATRLHLNSTSNFVQARLTHSATATFGLVLGSDNLSSALLNYDNTPLYFGTNGANRMVISASGSVGIGPGAISPAARLDVSGTVKIADGTEGAGKVLTSDATGNATWQNTGVPPGAIMAYGGNVIPAGWVLCDGSAILRTGVNANLFAAVGTAWGVGNGTTTFNVPDMRGMFLRGVDGGSGNDPNAATRFVNNAGGNTGNNVGSEQADEFEAHNHTIGNTINGALLGTSMIGVAGAGNTTGNAGGSTETRPKNVYVYYMIKL